MAERFAKTYGVDFLNWLLSDPPQPFFEGCWECEGTGTDVSDGPCGCCGGTGRSITNEVRIWRAYRMMMGCNTIDNGSA